MQYNFTKAIIFICPALFGAASHHITDILPSSINSYIPHTLRCMLFLLEAHTM